MNAAPVTNNRYTVILIAILIVVLLVLIVNVFLWLSMLSGEMMMGNMMGMHSMMNDQMIQACIKMMQNH